VWRQRPAPGAIYKIFASSPNVLICDLLIAPFALNPIREDRRWLTG
jgi:hypothetical protein